MGREIKRVPINFDWPKDKIWEGFLNPHYEGHCFDCKHCEGGSSPQAKMLCDLWYGKLPFHPVINGSEPFTTETKAILDLAKRNIAMAPQFYRDGVINEAKRLCEHFNSSWNHHLNQSDVDALWKSGRLGHSFKKRPTASEVNLWSLHGLAHDSINNWVCVKARCKANKWPTECAFCKGTGSRWDSPENKRRANGWKMKEPPKGEGYQLWETVSEGSPISPVFSTPDELADWLANSPDYKWRQNDRWTTRDQWLAFIRGPGWAPTFISDGSRLMTGVEACSSK